MTSFLGRAFDGLSLKGGAGEAFDARFYLEHYEDLRFLKTRKRALRHYLGHGKAEGRFPNEAAWQAHVSDLRKGFDLAAYKFHNRDLAHRFGTDEEFFRHYVNHGHREGRQCRFSDDSAAAEPVADADKWKAIFSTGDFLAWAGGELAEIPTTRAQALALFEASGVERLWPINVDYAFDPDFVRARGGMPGVGSAVSDAELYRAWLTEGFPAGIAPNERIFLGPYLGGAPIPAKLDWEAIGRRLGTARAAARSDVLLALFDASAREVLAVLDLLGGQAVWLLERIGRRALAAGDTQRAGALLARCIALAPTAELHALLADTRRREGAITDALEDYRAAIAMDGAPLCAFLESAAILAARQDFAAAYDVLRAGRPAWRHRTAFAGKFSDVVQLHFDHASAAAHALYRRNEPDARRQADRLLSDTLDDIRDRYLELDDLPAAIGGDPEGHIAILANDDLPQCTHYRIEQKVRAFELAGIPVRVFSHYDVDGFADSLIGARAAIFYRVGAVPAVMRAILHARAMGLPTWYEIDDLLFDPTCYPDPLTSFEGQITAEQHAGLQFGVPLFRYALSLCRSAIASTPALAERMRLLVGSGAGRDLSTDAGCTIVLRNGLDDRNLAAIRMGAAPVRSGERVRIFYGSGTKAHNADFNRLVSPALVELMRDHPQVDLVIVGHLKPGPELDAFADRIVFHPFIADVTTYWSVLAACDINIAVLEPSPVADCKSEIKWLEAAILQVPSVVSDTRTYREVVEEGADGLIARDAAEWHAHLTRLVEQPRLRAAMGARARTKALSGYDLDVGAAVLRTAFRSSAGEIVARRLRVLVCNVFYAPQSYGGATRVVEGNVGAFIRDMPDLDIAVFCSEEGAAPPGRLRIDAVDGVPVYRLATAPNPQMDWTPFDAGNAAAFARVLDHFRPDIVHFHCIQRLTATIVDVTGARDIPYVVTLHDGWWISDDQFLVDRDGILHLPGRDVLADSATARDPLAALARRQRLTTLLQNAEANLAVSASFARIYADAGIDRLRVIENGASPIAARPHLSRADGRVALGHIGGRSAHKGAMLLEAVLRRGTYANLHLTMVDGSLTAGEVVETVWGATPVTLVAPVPQSDVASLYAKLDVLLAPSTWPESYGLVTREAIAAGLWVVASRLGAIGEDVEDGRNGYLVDIATPCELAAALSTIDADPSRHRSRPPMPSIQREQGGQAERLRALYHEIAGACSNGSETSDKIER